MFAVFERVGEDNMAVEAIPVEEMERATKWGEAFAAFIIQMLNRLEDQNA